MTAAVPVLRCLVVDDEHMARQRMQRLLLLQEAVCVVGVCADADSALGTIAEGGTDVVFLDINMPGLSGTDAAARMPDREDGRPAIVFATAHADHAVSAFALGAVDYLLKPIEEARLAQAIERVRRTFHAPPPMTSTMTMPPLSLPTRTGVMLVSPFDVSHATLENDLVTIWVDTPSVRSIITDMSLTELEGKLPQDRCVRVHRRAIVNLWKVVRLTPVDSGGYTAWLPGGAAVEVSRAAARELRRRMAARGGL